MNETLHIFTIQKQSRIIDVVEAIKKNKNKCVIVCEKDKVIGVISEGDILEALLSNVDVHSSIDNWINYNFKFLEEFDLKKGMNLFLKYGITLIPILDKSFYLKDILKISDVLKEVKIK